MNNFNEILSKLRDAVKPEHIKKRGAANNTRAVEFIEWHTVAEILDEVVGDWSHTVNDVVAFDHLAVVSVSLTINGVTRSAVGAGTAENGDGVKKAEHDALKRAAAKFGIGRGLLVAEADIEDQEETKANTGQVKRLTELCREMKVHVGDAVRKYTEGRTSAIDRMFASEITSAIANAEKVIEEKKKANK